VEVSDSHYAISYIEIKGVCFGFNFVYGEARIVGISSYNAPLRSSYIDSRALDINSGGAIPKWPMGLKDGKVEDTMF
jgi:hypothetical protein